jgi:hypothetical protein
VIIVCTHPLRARFAFRWYGNQCNVALRWTAGIENSRPITVRA